MSDCKCNSEFHVGPYFLDGFIYFLIFRLIGTLLFVIPWHSDTRYAMQYGVSYSHIYRQDKPRDCWFWTAPLGEKNCHYEISSVHDGNEVYISWNKVEE